MTDFYINLFITEELDFFGNNEFEQFLKLDCNLLANWPNYKLIIDPYDCYIKYKNHTLFSNLCVKKDEVDALIITYNKRYSQVPPCG